MEIDLSDKTFDGLEEGDRFVNGLGQLVDGQRGQDNFRTDISGLGKGECIFEIFLTNFAGQKPYSREIHINFIIAKP